MRVWFTDRYRQYRWLQWFSGVILLMFVLLIGQTGYYLVWDTRSLVLTRMTCYALEALPGVGNYLNFVTKFIFGFGVAFLLPVLLMLLEAAGIVTRMQLKSGRRYAIVGAFAIAAVLTPPDIVSQLLLAVPLCLLYELAIIAIWFTEKRRARVPADAAAVE